MTIDEHRTQIRQAVILAIADLGGGKWERQEDLLFSYVDGWLAGLHASAATAAAVAAVDDALTASLGEPKADLTT